MLSLSLSLCLSFLCIHTKAIFFPPRVFESWFLRYDLQRLAKGRGGGRRGGEGEGGGREKESSKIHLSRQNEIFDLSCRGCVAARAIFEAADHRARVYVLYVVLDPGEIIT